MPGEGGDAAEDIRCDSLGEFSEEDDIVGMHDLHQKLIDIDEEIGEDEFEALKFLCRDFIPVARLQKAEAPLNVFMEMKKLCLIDCINVDFLLELLGCMHRFDLIRKLDMDVTAVRKNMPNFNKLDRFRIMLLSLTEDVDDKEAEKIRFFLRGRMRKKMLNEKQPLLQLMIFMEQEGLLSSDNLETLTAVMVSIRRGDLVDRIRGYQGLPPLQSNEPGLQPVVTGNVSPKESPVLSPPIDMADTHQLRQNENPSTNRQIDRSASAGTISVSSDENTVQSVGGILPEALFHQIVVESKDQDVELAIELEYSNEEIAQYKEQFTDQGQRVRRFILDWQNKLEDKGIITSRLLHVLIKLGCKSAASSMRQWMESFNIGQVPINSVFRNEESENHCSSLRHAMPVGQQIPVTSVQPPYIDDRLIQDLTRLGITPENLPHNQDVNFVNNIALYQLQDQVVANSGISQQLKPKPVTINTGPIPPPNQVPQVHTVNTGTSAQIIVPATIGGLPRYKMDRKPRGWCVIINNETFNVDTGDAEAKEMPPRKGTERDAENLCKTFKNLGFIVRRHDNLPHNQMMTVLVDVAHNVCHDKFDCFVCCVLTHGVLNNLYGSDGMLVPIKDLTTTFQTNRCKSLAGKPKLFFFQACQGRDKMTGGEINHSGYMEQDGPHDITSGRTQSIRNMEMIPNEADFLLGFATVPGYVSFRSRNQGSWYIRKLCELLDKYAHQYDLMSILTELNREVGNANANMDNAMYKQCPAPLVTLRKQLYFM